MDGNKANRETWPTGRDGIIIIALEEIVVLLPVFIAEEKK